MRQMACPPWTRSPWSMVATKALSDSGKYLPELEMTSQVPAGFWHKPETGICVCLMRILLHSWFKRVGKT
jgi:hypothetical protein